MCGLWHLAAWRNMLSDVWSVMTEWETMVKDHIGLSQICSYRQDFILGKFEIVKNFSFILITILDWIWGSLPYMSSASWPHLQSLHTTLSTFLETDHIWHPACGVKAKETAGVAYRPFGKMHLKYSIGWICPGMRQWTLWDAPWKSCHKGVFFDRTHAFQLVWVNNLGLLVLWDGLIDTKQLFLVNMTSVSLDK